MSRRISQNFVVFLVRLFPAPHTIPNLILTFQSVGLDYLLEHSEIFAEIPGGAELLEALRIQLEEQTRAAAEGIMIFGLLRCLNTLFLQPKHQTMPTQSPISRLEP
eukprot:1395030-Amorphochlora_amoeboformis.AAC.1